MASYIIAMRSPKDTMVIMVCMATIITSTMPKNIYMTTTTMRIKMIKF